jgi:hypothetical protein
MGEWSDETLQQVPQVIAGICQRERERQDEPALQPVAG